MVGSSVAVGSEVASALREEERVAAAGTTHSRCTVVDTDDITISRGAYGAYPIRRFESDDYEMILEGHIYDRNVSLAVLEAIAHDLFKDQDSLAEILTNCDGEFLLTCIEKDTSQVAVTTDVLGRLPTYIASDDTGAILSREIRTIRSVGTAVGRDPLIDRMAAAQYLLFAYPLGNRTLFDGIRRLPPAAVVTTAPGEPVEISQYHVHRYDRATTSVGDFDTAVSELAARFQTACRNRVTVRPENMPIVSLSGGLDSRALAAAVSQASDETIAATMTRAAVSADEIEIANEVADELEIPWDTYEIGKTPELFDELLELKQGQNYLMWAHTLDFYDQLRMEQGGNLTLFAGGGGDKILPDLRAPREFETMTDLVSYILRMQGVSNIEDAAAIAGVSQSVLRDSVRDEIEAYPEKSLAHRYVHFQIHERGRNWLVENEDLPRQYFWADFPFWAWPVFNFAMQCPERYKSGERFQRRFIAELDESLLPLRYADTGAPMTSPTHRAKQFGYAFLRKYLRLRESLKSIFGMGMNYGDLPVTRTKQELGELEHTAFSTRVVDFLKKDELTARQLYTVLTVLAVAADTDQSDTGERLFAIL